MVTRFDVGKTVKALVTTSIGLTSLTKLTTITGKLLSLHEMRAVVEQEVKSPVIYKLTHTINAAKVSRV